MTKRVRILWVGPVRRDRAPGDVLDLDDDEADPLIDAGHAELVREGKGRPKAAPATEPKPETATADAAPETAAARTGGG